MKEAPTRLQIRDRPAVTARLSTGALRHRCLVTRPAIKNNPPLIANQGFQTIRLQRLSRDPTLSRTPPTFMASSTSSPTPRTTRTIPTATTTTCALWESLAGSPCRLAKRISAAPASRSSETRRDRTPQTLPVRRPARSGPAEKASSLLPPTAHYKWTAAKTTHQATAPTMALSLISADCVTHRS